MPKGPSKNFGVSVTVTEDGRTKYRTDGKPMKTLVQMGPGVLPDGSSQSFYDENGVFKGTAQILRERGLHVESKLRLTCPKFECKVTTEACCQRRVLYNQPDFQEQLSTVELVCSEQGFAVMFLPKFHCELNPIEQCWGHSKRVYREYPPSPREDVLEKNVLTSLATVDVYSIRR